MRDDSKALASWERESVIDEERERYWHGRDNREEEEFYEKMDTED